MEIIGIVFVTIISLATFIWSTILFAATLLMAGFSHKFELLITLFFASLGLYGLYNIFTKELSILIS